MGKDKNIAFTLVELIVVITLLSILGTVAFISYTRNNGDARDAMRISNTKIMSRDLWIRINAEQILNPLEVIESPLSQNELTSWSIMQDYSLSSSQYSVGIWKKIIFWEQDFLDPSSKNPYPVAILKADEKIYYQIAASLESGIARVQGNYFKMGTWDLDGIIKSADGNNPVISGWIFLPY